MHVSKAVGVLSVAKILGLIYGTLGLLFMPIFLLVGMAGMMVGGRNSAFSGVAGLVLALLLPILYGGMGFIFGAIGALLYNLFAKWVGGIEVQVQISPVFQPPVIP
ncbi:MAG: hypothetical protein WB952_04615 [Terriglobales bacterium]